MIFRNHNNIPIRCSRNISDYYQLKTEFLWKQWYFYRSGFFVEYEVQKNSKSVVTVCVFTVAFDQCIPSLKNNSIRFSLYFVYCSNETESDWLLVWMSYGASPELISVVALSEILDLGILQRDWTCNNSRSSLWWNHSLLNFEIDQIFK